MQITLETVRTTLRDAFGPDSFVASFIAKVVPDDRCPTAAINAQGVMRYNPDFVRQYVTGAQELFCLIAHELMHPMFGHFVYQSGGLEGIGADLVINAVLTRVFSSPSGEGSLFRKLYKPIGIEGLLRPESDMYQSRYSSLYYSFYQNHGSGQKLSTGEVIQTLKVLTPTVEVPCLLLLGSHGPREPQAETEPIGRFPAEILAHIAQDLARAAEEPNRHTPGFGHNLYEFFLEVLQTHLTLKKVLLLKFATRQKVDRFRHAVSRQRVGVSPIPIRPSKRDFVLLAAGIPPFHYHNHVTKHDFEERGLAVYLDVSGSVNDHLPEIIGVLRTLDAHLKTVFLFSNEVIEVPFRSLLQGHIQTTYGTDFDCIAQHLIERRLDKAVILTDGYARLSEENQQELRKRKLHTLTILFGGDRTCPDFEAFGDVVHLEDVTY